MKDDCTSGLMDQISSSINFRHHIALRVKLSLFNAIARRGTWLEMVLGKSLINPRMLDVMTPQYLWLDGRMLHKNPPSGKSTTHFFMPSE